jgi:phosphoribosylcarboxyaminoimidazole (NCAIR) mutase
VRLYDVGVAGLHRLLAHTDEIMRASVIVAVAGMEGALASVIGGLADCPVIAVPTSVGYGASFGGVAALLAMLNSCASGVSVVNIDNGFGAGYQAASSITGRRKRDENALSRLRHGRGGRHAHRGSAGSCCPTAARAAFLGAAERPRAARRRLFGGAERQMRRHRHPCDRAGRRRGGGERRRAGEPMSMNAAHDMNTSTNMSCEHEHEHEHEHDHEHEHEHEHEHDHARA